MIICPPTPDPPLSRFLSASISPRLFASHTSHRSKPRIWAFRPLDLWRPPNATGFGSRSSGGNTASAIRSNCVGTRQRQGKGREEGRVGGGDFRQSGELEGRHRTKHLYMCVCARAQTHKHSVTHTTIHIFAHAHSLKQSKRSPQTHKTSECASKVSAREGAPDLPCQESVCGQSVWRETLRVHASCAQPAGKVVL